MNNHILFVTQAIILILPLAEPQVRANVQRNDAPATSLVGAKTLMPAELVTLPGTGNKAVPHPHDSTAGSAAAEPGVPHDSLAATAPADSVDDRVDFGVFSFGYSRDTYVPSIGMCKHFSVYTAELFIPLTVLAKDPYNENKWELSWSALVTVGAMFVTAPFPDKSVVRYVLLWPIMFLNSVNNLMIVGPKGLTESDSFWLTVHVGCRTDFYARYFAWIRWTPMAGVQLGFPITRDDATGTAWWLALTGGIEAPIDVVTGPQAMPPRFFVGLKCYAPLR